MTEQEAHRPAASRCRWWGLLADVALVLFVAGLGVKAAYGGWEIHDLDAADECCYMIVGLSVGKQGIPPVESSPIYILWDGLLGRLGVPATNIPFVSWAGLACLLPASLYILVRALGGGRLAALVAGGLLPATTLIDIYPYPMHLATVVLALGTALAACFRRAAPTAAVLGLTLLLATFTRPEFLYSLYLFVPLAGLGGAWMLWRRPESRRSVLISAVGFAAAAGLVLWVFGSPKGEGRRSLVAFGQHYALNRALAGARPENPWHQWRMYVRDDFGDAATLGDVWRANREAFLWHVKTNAGNLPKHLREAAAPRVDLRSLHEWHVFPSDQPPKHPRTVSIARRGMLAALVFGLVGAVIGLRRQLTGREEGGKLPVAVLMLGLVAAPAVAASLIVYPRFHYLIPTIVFAAALVAAGCRHLPVPSRLRGRLVSFIAIVGAAIGLALVVPNRAEGWCLQCRLGEGENGRSIVRVPAPMRACVDTIRGLGLRPPVLFLDYDVARSYYTGFAGATILPARMKPGEGFLGFVKRMKLGLVVVDATMGENPQLRDDPDFQSLLRGKESDLFRLFSIEGVPHIRLAVRRDLLPPGS
jgi:hypothetical protein